MTNGLMEREVPWARTDVQQPVAVTCHEPCHELCHIQHPDMSQCHGGVCSIVVLVAFALKSELYENLTGPQNTLDMLTGCYDVLLNYTSFKIIYDNLRFFNSCTKNFLHFSFTSYEKTDKFKGSLLPSLSLSMR